jgi:cytidylate kinase
MATSKTLIFIIGSQAVGKMTVGQELSRATGYKFMSNHQTIDMLLPTFDYGSPSFKRLLFDFRVSIFEEVAASELPGFIFSCVPDFDSVLDRSQTECYAAPFLRRGGRVLFVELEASFRTRLARNRTEHRQHHKPSKRDTEFSEKLLREEECRSNSDSDFPYSYPHLKINNETLSPQEVVSEICAHFGLEASEEKL